MKRGKYLEGGNGGVSFKRKREEQTPKTSQAENEDALNTSDIYVLQG